MCSIVNNQSNLCILHVDSALFHHMACSLFVVVTSVDQVVGLLLLGQCLLLLTRRISMSFHIWYRDVNISCL